MADKPNILVVDDEEGIATLVRAVLADAGMDSEVAHSSGAALDATERTAFDLIIMDVMLGDRDGFDTLSIMRDRGIAVPALFLTARDTVEDKVAGLNIGDDYLTKPFTIDELVARVRTLLRRANNGVQPVLTCGDITLDETTYEVTCQGKVVATTPTEFRLLRTLMRHPDKVITRNQILNAVWEYEDGNRASVDTYISYLRKKLDTDGGESRIATIRGFGYTMRPRG